MIAAHTLELLAAGEPWPVRHGCVVQQEAGEDLVFELGGEVVRVAGPTYFHVIDRPSLRPLRPWEELPRRSRGKRRRAWS